MRAMDRRTFLATAGTLLLPAAGCAAPPRAGVPPVVDAHCHVFNASDLPVRDYLETVVVAEKGLDPAAGRLLAALLEPLASMAPTAGDELRELASLRTFAPGGARLDRLRRQRDDENRAILEAVRQRVQEDPQVRRDLQELALRGARSLFGAEAPGLLPPGLVASERLERLLALPGLGEIWEFLKPMLRRRASNCVTLLDAHGGDGTMLFAAMVDFDGWLGDAPVASPVASQVAVMAALADALAPRVRYYVPFNPLAEIRAPGTLDALLAATDAPHAIGFKLYPPMGFAPSGNARLAPGERPARWARIMKDWPDLPRRLDDTMHDFLVRSGRADVAILAHGNPSFGPDANADGLGSPARWDAAIGAASKSLRFCAGHFGSDLPVAGRPDWREGWAQLVDRYPNVYGDLSYWATILGARGQATAIADLAARVQRHPRLRDRLLFGSDWSMVALEPGWDRYRERFENAMRPVFGADLTRVLHANALSFATRRKELP